VLGCGCACGRVRYRRVRLNPPRGSPTSPSTPLVRKRTSADHPPMIVATAGSFNHHSLVDE
jgi:hypothetical protein